LNRAKPIKELFDKRKRERRYPQGLMRYKVKPSDRQTGVDSCESHSNGGPGVIGATLYGTCAVDGTTKLQVPSHAVAFDEPVAIFRTTFQRKYLYTCKN
jgi:hypothetical protein